MAEHEQGAQIGVEVAPLDRTEFDYFMSWAQRLGMSGHWSVFACEVHAAVVIALGFAELTPDCDDAEARRIGDQQRRLAAVLLDARSKHHPRVTWDAFRDAVWEGCQRLAVEPTIGRRLGLSWATDMPPDSEPDGPGIPIRVLPWFERLQFELAIAEVAGGPHRADPVQLGQDLEVWLIGALALDAVWVDRDLHAEAARIEKQRRRVGRLVRRAQSRFDPHTHWEELREALWAGRHQLSLNAGSAGTPIGSH
jgi:hypothetical protein